MNTDPQRWERLKALFDRAVEMPAEERKEFLSELKIDERTLFDELYELIAVDEAAAAALDETDGGDEAASLIGTSIGSYRIVRELGRGGMGTVFEGLREDGDFEKRVAIKLTGRSIFSDDLIRRFRNEKQILARLEHPNIVRLLDGGITTTHVPYYVMEFVDGMPITRFAAANSLDTRSRLELFLKVTDAVAYAHRQLVVHRDLKPSNILVTPEGSVRLLDFGIAKGLEDEHQTLTMGVPLTPDYASPEQIKGDAVSTGSDVYSLGVLLFELLTGLDPAAIYGERKQYFHQAVLDTDPVKPSEAVTRHRRNKSETEGDGSRELARGLAGDLDNIILHCLEKTPESRYPTVDGLAADIRAFLEGMPVAAHPQSRAYRWRKYARRNAMPLAAASAALLLIFAGSGAAVYQSTVAREQQQLAEARFQQVRKVANALIFDYHDEIAKLEGSLALREKLVTDAVAYLDAIYTEEVSEIELLNELGVAYRKIGDVQGAAYLANTGNLAEAIENYRKAVELHEKIARLDHSDLNSKRELATSYYHLANALQRSGSADTALSFLKAGIKLLESDDENLGVEELIVLNELRRQVPAYLNDNEGRYQEYLRVINLLQPLLVRYPSEPRFIDLMGKIQSVTGNSARFAAYDMQDAGKPDDARRYMEAALRHYMIFAECVDKALPFIDNRSLAIRRSYGVAVALADAQIRLGRFEIGLRNLAKAKELNKQLQLDQGNKEAKMDQLRISNTEQDYFILVGRNDLAMQNIEESIKLAKEDPRIDRTNVETTFYLFHFHQKACKILNRDSDSDKNESRHHGEREAYYAGILRDKLGSYFPGRAYF